jgi:hypothetical protein
MPTSTERKDKKEKDKDSKEPDDVKKPKEVLPEYKYTGLSNLDALRLLRLRPANDTQEDIDCEIIEIGLPEERNVDSSGSGPDKQKDDRQDSSSSDELPLVNESRGENEVSDEEDSSEDEGKPSSRVQTNVKKDDTTPVEAPEEHSKPRPYEAVSWCWGREPADQILRVQKVDRVFAFHISKNLKSALWALRKNDEVRHLWIDAICINQKDTKERNQQVPRMDRIYGGAENVCIWLGESDDDSDLAIKFIKERVLEIWDFDKLIENKEMAAHWAALIKLMKRPWFSRRWVVQEIALSPRGGTIYCGKDHCSWQDFADAVSLFVEVESATHRVSDVMKLDESFGNIPDYFGEVSSLGAALLVEATSNLFRNATKGERRPLSSLEYLVSRLSVFEATQPRDTIYALLAISRDTTPKNLKQDSDSPSQSQQEIDAMALLPSQGFVKQNYNVDYRLPCIDVYQEFMDFAIRKRVKLDPTRALDIICRPWAPTVMKQHDDPDFLSGKSDKTKDGEQDKKKKEEYDQEIPLPSWIPSLSGAAFEMEEHPIAGLRMERQNADPLVGMPDEPGHRTYSAAGDRGLDLKKLKFVKWETLKAPDSSYSEYSMFVRGFVLDEVSTLEHLASNGNIPYRWLKVGGWYNTDEYPPEKFWRTLVADRGHSGRNPPTYFPRACKESMKFKAQTMSKIGGNLDCRKLIYEGRCTIVAQFLRRVQEVIWNRQLMNTKGGRLGLVRDDVSPGFKVCILYGCSVPVILQQIKKSPEELKAEQRDRYKRWRKEVKRVVAVCQARYVMRRQRRQRRERLQKAQKSEHEADPPKTAVECYKRLQRRRRPSWPLRPTELADYSGFVRPTQGVSSQTSALEAEGALHNILIAALEVPLPESRPASPDGSSSPLGNGTTPQRGEQSSQTNIQPPHNEHSDEQTPSDSIPPADPTKERNKKRPKPARRKTEQEKQKMWADQHAQGKEEYKARKLKERKRPVPESSYYYYRLFGECYIHGMMNGEAIALQNKEQMKEQEFELR